MTQSCCRSARARSPFQSRSLSVGPGPNFGLRSHRSPNRGRQRRTLPSHARGTYRDHRRRRQRSRQRTPTPPHKHYLLFEPKGHRMSDQQQDRLAALWSEAVERHVGGLSDTDFQALLARARPAEAPPAQPTMLPAPLTPYEIAQAQNARKRDGFRAKVDQLVNIPTGRNGALSSMPADSGTEPSAAGTPELPEAVAPAPHQPRPSLTPLGLTTASRAAGPRSRVGLEPRPGLQVR